MIKNYFKIGWRNILKNPFYSIINIIGLSAGITFTMMVLAHVWNESRVNKSLRNADRQFIIQSKLKDPNLGYYITTAGPLAKALHDNYPGLVSNYYRYDGITSNISKGDKSFREGLQVGDTTLLSMYGFGLMHGDPATAFQQPFSVVMTADKAIKFFGKTDVVGQTITIENFSGSKHDFLITGVLKRFNRNSITHLVEDYPNGIFVSNEHLAFFGRNMDWNNTAIAAYLELKKGVKATDLDAPMRKLMKINATPQISANLSPYLISLKTYYLVGNNGLVKKMLYALSALAFFILLMAVVNFINMTVSRSSARMREIGIRKVLGGLRRQLIGQFLSESILIVFFATMFSILLYWLTRGLFSSMLGKEIPTLNAFPIYFAFCPLLLILFTGLLAGLYPAFVLSSLRTVESLKGKLNTVKEKVLLRKLLVGFQFGTATIVFAGAMIIARQINLFFSKDLGYDKEYVMAAQVPRDWSAAGVSQMENLRDQFAMMPEVSNVSLSYEVLDGNNSGNSPIYRTGTDSSTAIASQLLMTDEYFAGTYGIPMEAGEFYSKPGAYKDSTKLVINNASVKALGWKDPEEAMGKQISFQGGGTFTIAGVTKDFHFGSMQKTILPVVFLHVGLTNTFRFFSFKLKPGNLGQTISSLQKKWSALMPGAPFEYKFMDETLKNLYRSEIQLKKSSYLATVLSFIIVLLGVIGLVSLSIQKRTKEIGIRKVLGCSVRGILSLFMKEFIWMIGLTGLVACPIAWILMRGWLSDYVYRVPLTPGPFLLSVVGLAMITAALITVQTIRTGLDNPVKSLRTE